jgi:hypothetical protein
MTGNQGVGRSIPLSSSGETFFETLATAEGSTRSGARSRRVQTAASPSASRVEEDDSPLKQMIGGT